MKSNPLSWVLIFSLIMVLAVVFLFSAAPEGLGLFGLPNWLLIFIGIELLYCLAMYWFVKDFWSEEKES